MATTKELATVGEGGTFIWIKDAGHEIYASHLNKVVRVINQLLNR